MNSEPLQTFCDFAEVETRGRAESQLHYSFSPVRNTVDRVDNFERRIRRDPTDLKAHVQRIRYYRTLNDSPGCYAALVDLFIALGPRGADLRKRMIRLTVHLLTPYLRSFFENYLDVGISARTPLPIVTSSILTEAISGTTELVESGTSDSLAR